MGRSSWSVRCKNQFASEEPEKSDLSVQLRKSSLDVPLGTQSPKPSAAQMLFSKFVEERDEKPPASSLPPVAKKMAIINSGRKGVQIQTAVVKMFAKGIDLVASIV